MLVGLKIDERQHRAGGAAPDHQRDDVHGLAAVGRRERALHDSAGRERASFELEKGALVDCRTGRLSGESAFYQLFEVPAPGTFELIRLPAEGTTARPSLEMMGLLMESMRRFDEFQRARLLVPNTAPLVAGYGKPSAPQGEADGDLLRRLWTAVRGGTTSVLDMWRYMEGSAHAAGDVGIRATLAPYGADRYDYFESIESNRRLLETHLVAADGRVRSWVGLEHLFYCSPGMFRAAAELAEEFGTGIHTHSSESIWEVEECLRQNGRRPIEEMYQR